MRCAKPPLFALLSIVALAAASGAGEADVLAVEPHCNEAGTVCKFSVTIRHADAGWDHYANMWEVVAPDGRVLEKRVLRHPHDEEQPFTRSMRAIRIPDGVTRVTVRAIDSQHGPGGKTVTVDLTQPAPSGKSASEAPPSDS